MLSTTISFKGTISKSNGFKRKKFDIYIIFDIYTVNAYIQHYSTTQYYIRRIGFNKNLLSPSYRPGLDVTCIVSSLQYNANVSFDNVEKERKIGRID